MGSIDFIFANQDHLSSQLFKKTANECGYKSYILSDAENVSFLIQDLNPKVIICSYHFFSNYSDELLSAIEDFSGKKVLCGEKEHPAFNTLWPEKMDMFNLPASLSKLLEGES